MICHQGWFWALYSDHNDRVDLNPSVTCLWISWNAINRMVKYVENLSTNEGKLKKKYMWNFSKADFLILKTNIPEMFANCQDGKRHLNNGATLLSFSCKLVMSFQYALATKMLSASFMLKEQHIPRSAIKVIYLIFFDRLIICWKNYEIWVV